MKRLIMAATILVLMIMLYSGEDLFLSDRGRTSSTDIDAVLYDGVDSSSAKTRDNNWEIRTVDSVGDVGRYPSIAIDSDDHLHVSYFYDTGDDLRYAYHNGNNWTIETVDSFGIVGKNTSLALDSDDHPHISYFNETGGDLKYAYHDGTQWNIETVDSFGTVGKYTSIALDSDDHRISVISMIRVTI